MPLLSPLVWLSSLDLATVGAEGFMATIAGQVATTEVKQAAGLLQLLLGLLLASFSP